MAVGEIRAIDRPCRSYRPGHQVHWIQAKKSMEDQQPVIDVAVVVHDDGRVGIEGDELKLTMWNHVACASASRRVRNRRSATVAPGAGGLEHG